MRKRTGVERDAMQQLNGDGKGQGDGRGGQVSSSLSILFACGPLLYSRYIYLFHLSFDSPYRQKIVATGL